MEQPLGAVAWKMAKTMTEGFLTELENVKGVRAMARNHKARRLLAYRLYQRTWLLLIIIIQINDISLNCLGRIISRGDTHKHHQNCCIRGCRNHRLIVA